MNKKEKQNKKQLIKLCNILKYENQCLKNWLIYFNVKKNDDSI